MTAPAASGSICRRLRADAGLGATVVVTARIQSGAAPPSRREARESPRRPRRTSFQNIRSSLGGLNRVGRQALREAPIMRSCRQRTSPLPGPCQEIWSAGPKQDRWLLRLMGLSRGRSSTSRQWRTVSLDSALASKQREGDHHDETDAGHAPARQFKEAHKGLGEDPSRRQHTSGTRHPETYPRARELTVGAAQNARSCHASNADERCISDGYRHGAHIPGRGRVLRPSWDVLSTRSTDGPAGPADR